MGLPKRPKPLPMISSTPGNANRVAALALERVLERADFAVQAPFRRPNTRQAGVPEHTIDSTSASVHQDESNATLSASNTSNAVRR